MTEKLNELRNIVYGFDGLLDYWFDGIPAGVAGAAGVPVYEMADDLRNRALRIIEELQDEKKLY